MNVGHSKSRCPQLFHIQYSLPPWTIHSITYPPASQKLREIKLNHVDKQTPCVLQNYLPILSHLKMNTLRAGQPRNLGSFTGKGKSIALSQFARLALGLTQSYLQWLMEINGQAMKLTAHLNLAPRLKVHGAISPLHHKLSYLVQGLPFLSFYVANFATPSFASYVMGDITFVYTHNASSLQFSGWKLLVCRTVMISSY